MKFKSPDYYTNLHKSKTNQPVEQKPVRPAESFTETRSVKAPVPPKQNTFWSIISKSIKSFFS